MTCIELLVLRAPSSDAKQALSAIDDLVKPDGLVGVWGFAHKTIPGDVAVLLEWNTEISAHGSALGLHPASVFSEHGLVSHSFWVSTSGRDEEEHPIT